MVLDQGSGVLASVDSVGAFVLDHRDRFADHRGAAIELAALLGEIDDIEVIW